jgi:hypothetical protein
VASRPELDGGELSTVVRALSCIPIARPNSAMSGHRSSGLFASALQMVTSTHTGTSGQIAETLEIGGYFVPVVQDLAGGKHRPI